MNKYLTYIRKNYLIFIIITLLFIVGFMSYLLLSEKSIEMNSALSTDNIKVEGNPLDDNTITFEEKLENAEKLYEQNKPKEALKLYESMFNEGKVNVLILTRLFGINIQLANFEDALKYYYILAKASNYNELFTGRPIEKNDLSKRVLDVYNKINEKEKNKDFSNLDTLYVDFAKLNYEVGDYYYNLDQEKYYFLILFSYLSVLKFSDQALTYNPNNSEAYYQKGKVLMDIGPFFELSEKELKKAIELKNDDFNYYYRLGNAYSNQSKNELAKQSFLKGIELNNNYEKLYLNLGNAYSELGDNLKAEQTYKDGIKICEFMCEDFYFNIGLHLSSDNHYKDALPYLDKAIEINSSMYKAYKIRGKTYYDLGLYDNAIRDFNSAILGGKDLNNIYYYLGDSYSNLGKFDEAKLFFEKILKSDPEFYQANDKLNSIKEEKYGNYVNLANGKFIYTNDLLKIPGNGLDYEFSLYYDSRTIFNGPNGINWFNNYNYYIVEEANGNILLYTGKGSIYRFLKEGENFSFNIGLAGTLEKNGDLYKVKMVNGLNYYFGISVKGDSARKNLTKIEDNSGNVLNFEYSNDLLSTVIDTKGRKINYNYYDFNRLKEIISFNGDKIDFKYYDSNSGSGNYMDLESIVQSKGYNITNKIKFEYFVGGEDILKNNITKIFDNDGNIYVTNTYDKNDMIIKQDYGSGSVVQYSYDLELDKVKNTTVTDERGYKKVYIYNSNLLNISTIYYDDNNQVLDVEKYEYNKDGFLSKKILGNGDIESYSYTDEGNVKIDK